MVSVCPSYYRFWERGRIGKILSLLKTQKTPSILEWFLMFDHSRIASSFFHTEFRVCSSGS